MCLHHNRLHVAQLCARRHLLSCSPSSSSERAPESGPIGADVYAPQSLIFSPAASSILNSHRYPVSLAHSLTSYSPASLPRVADSARRSVDISDRCVNSPRPPCSSSLLSIKSVVKAYMPKCFVASSVAFFGLFSLSVLSVFVTLPVGECSTLSWFATIGFIGCLLVPYRHFGQRLSS